MMRVSAPLIAQERKPGQFIIVQVDTDFGERIPLTIADADPAEGSITIVFQAVGKTTHKLAELNVGDRIENVLGPLGQPTHIEKVGRIIIVGGGFGVAPLYPIARAFKAAGNEVVVIMGARSRDLLIYEEEMRAVADEVIVTTDDGSRGSKGLVTDVLVHQLTCKPAGLVVSVGPAIMMRFVAEATRPFGVRTVVSLNPIMVDGTGMCGGCRVTVGGKTMFACVDGPEFDGHQVDWVALMNRQRSYIAEEKESFEAWKKRHERMLGSAAPVCEL